MPRDAGAVRQEGLTPALAQEFTLLLRDTVLSLPVTAGNATVGPSETQTATAGLRAPPPGLDLAALLSRAGQWLGLLSPDNVR